MSDSGTHPENKPDRVEMAGKAAERIGAKADGVSHYAHAIEAAQRSGAPEAEIA